MRGAFPDHSVNRLLVILVCHINLVLLECCLRCYQDLLESNVDIMVSCVFYDCTFEEEQKKEDITD
jgi:hypothetical protein